MKLVNPMFWYENPMLIKITRVTLSLILIGLLALLVTGCTEQKSVVGAVYPTSAQVHPAPAQEAPAAPGKGYVKTTVQESGLGNYSTGYRVGQIVKFSVKGLAFKSGEGEMLLGRESTPYVETYSCGENGSSTCRKVINPWSFSMAVVDAPLMKPFAGEYAWVKYNQSNVKSPKYSTDYIISQIGSIDRESDPVACTDPGAEGSKSEGVRVGRIVKASMKGTFSTTGEIKIQQGNSGSSFYDMSITDSMFKCVVANLKAARKVKVHYVEGWFRNPFASSTNYAVSKIEPIQDI